MWVYYQGTGMDRHLYTVGHFTDGQWYADEDFNTKEEARERVHYLNGGKQQEKYK